PMALLATALSELQLLLKDGRSRDVVWVTHGAQQVLDSDVPRPELSALWGLGRSFLREHPPLRLSLVDVDAFPLPESLLGFGEDTWAGRGGGAFHPRLVGLPADRTWRAAATEGAVLITGGLGALGLRIAEHLVRVHGVRRLVLAGRRPPDGERRQR